MQPRGLFDRPFILFRGSLVCPAAARAPLAAGPSQTIMIMTTLQVIPCCKPYLSRIYSTVSIARRCSRSPTACERKLTPRVLLVRDRSELKEGSDTHDVCVWRSGLPALRGSGRGECGRLHQRRGRLVNKSCTEAETSEKSAEASGMVDLWFWIFLGKLNGLMQKRAVDLFLKVWRMPHCLRRHM